MHQQGGLARCRRALERGRRHADDDPATRKLLQHIPGGERTLDRVELVAAFDEPGGCRRVEVGAERDHQDVGVERADIGRHAPGDRIQRADHRGTNCTPG